MESFNYEGTKKLSTRSDSVPFSYGSNTPPAQPMDDQHPSAAHPLLTDVDPNKQTYIIQSPKVLIISLNFYNSPYFRHGNQRDKNSLLNLFEKMGVKPTVLEDKFDERKNKASWLVSSEIERLVHNWSNNKDGVLDEADSLIVVMMSHGNKDIIMLNSGYIETRNIINQFSNTKCTKLATKPKLFFLQCCQGDKIDPGIILTYQDKARSDSIQKNQSPITFSVGTWTEFFIAQACFEGCVAIRDKNGSWFIQNLVSIFETNIPSPHHDLLQMMTEVNRKVGEYNGDPENKTIKEVPCFYSTLTKRIKFKFSK